MQARDFTWCGNTVHPSWTYCQIRIQNALRKGQLKLVQNDELTCSEKKKERERERDIQVHFGTRWYHFRWLTATPLPSSKRQKQEITP